ncbi:MAG: CehA/McbA family metallohydrolase [Alkalispirochaeta sp.]
MNGDTDPAPGTRGVIALDTIGHIAGPRLSGYDTYEVTLPRGVTEVRALLTYTDGMLFLTVFGPDGYRGTVMNPDARGRVTLDALCRADTASPGVIAGTIEKGVWRFVIDHGPDLEEIDYRLLVLYTEEPATDDGVSVEPALVAKAVPEEHMISRGRGWYRGELHAHSIESDGKQPASVVAAIAEEVGLDFISLTDHFAMSGWYHMRRALTGRTLLIRGCEITSRLGHANVHGITSPIDPCVDGPGWTINDAADEVHRQGGIFGINHPFAAVLGWRNEDLDWDKVDVMEVIHGLDRPNNNLQLALWDHHLRVGRRIVGVGGTDSHDPGVGRHRLGRLVTWVDADELSEGGIIEGIRRGRVIVSWGPFVEFEIMTNDGTWGMWETLPVGTDPVTIRVQVTTDSPLRVFVLKNGMPLTYGWVTPSSSGTAEYTAFDTPRYPGYYRVEIHGPFEDADDASTRKAAGWRDYRSLLAVTNPILVG